MPLVGARELSGDVDFLATMGSFATEAVTLCGVQLLQVVYECAMDEALTALPAALHPTLPATVSVLVYDVPDSPWGRFALAQIRVGARIGDRPRGFLTGAVINTEDAQAALAQRWGYTTSLGEVMLRPRYDAVHAEVRVGDLVALEMALIDPTPVGAGEIHVAANMNPANTPRGLRLVQVDPDMTVHLAQRGRAHIATFDPLAWPEHTVRPASPLIAIYAKIDLTLPQLRYLSLPDTTAYTGTEAINPAAQDDDNTQRRRT